MLQPETFAEHNSRNPTAGSLETLPASDSHVPCGHRLEQARAADQDWRSARSHPVQDRLSRAFGTQEFGQWIAFAGFWTLALGSWIIAFGCCLVSLCGYELDRLLFRAFVSPVLLPGISLIVSVMVGLCLALAGRCHRMQLLRWARRHSIVVDDPGDPPLPTFQGK